MKESKAPRSSIVALEKTVLERRSAALTTLSQPSRFFGLVLLVTEAGLGTAGYATSSDTLRLSIIVAIIILFLVAMVLVYKLEAQTIAKNTLIIPAPPTGRSADDETIRYEYDVYLATAVAAIEGDADRSARMADVATLANAIERSGEESVLIRVFNACAKIKSRAAFDDPALALANNIKRMRASRHLALLYFENLPTSALIEVGMALSLGKDNVWFLKQGIQVPFLLQGQLVPETGMPKVRVVRFADFAELKHLIEKHGSQYFPIRAPDRSTQATL